MDYGTSEEEDHLSDIMIKHWEEDLNKGRFPAYPYPSARICTTVSELMGLGEDEDTDSGTENSGEEDEMTLSDIMIKHWEENFEEGMSFPHTLPLSLRICTTVSELMSLDVDEDTDSGTTESRETHGTAASLDGIIDFDINNAPESDSSAYNSDDPQRKEKALERMWKRQTRSDYLNMIPNHRVRGGKPNPVVDRRFRDVRNNILNSGQIFQFTELRYRWFLDHTNTPPFQCPVPPCPRPTFKRSNFTFLLKTEVGLISDRVDHKRTKTKLMKRGGGKAFVTTLAKKGKYEGFALTDQDGARLSRKYVWLYETITDNDFPNLAMRAFEAFQRESLDEENSMNLAFRAWGREQRHWEWRVFQQAREHCMDIRWPKGEHEELGFSTPTKEELFSLQYRDVVSGALISGVTHQSVPDVILNRTARDDANSGVEDADEEESDDEGEKLEDIE